MFKEGVLLYLVFVVDPVIYILRLPDVRQVLKDKLRGVVTCSNRIKGRYQAINLKRPSAVTAQMPDTGMMQSTYF